VVVPPVHQSSNPRFDICVSYIKTEYSMLIGVGCACVHRGEYMRVYVSAYVCTVFLKKTLGRYIRSKISVGVFILIQGLY
jgi:hypothetical protein